MVSVGMELCKPPQTVAARDCRLVAVSFSLLLLTCSPCLSASIWTSGSVTEHRERSTTVPVAVLLRQARQLDLTDEQRTKLREISRKAIERQQSLKQKLPRGEIGSSLTVRRSIMPTQEVAGLHEEISAEIYALLTIHQRESLQAQLERLSRRTLGRRSGTSSTVSRKLVP